MVKVYRGVESPGSSVESFFKFIEERYAIYIRRTRGDEWPWTDDTILQKYKFTNIFRELDTGTIYCREAIRDPYADHPELFFNVAMYRLFNWVPTFETIGFVEEFDTKYVNKVVRRMREQGQQIFTGAHMITGTLGGDKIHQVVDICLAQLWENRRKLEPQPGDTLEMAFNRLCKKNPGYGAFIAYEVITDLRWTRYLNKAGDIMTWANPGPGACRGINRIVGIFVYDKSSTYDYLGTMRQLLEVSSSYLPSWVPLLEMRDIEHSLCEYDKYERCRLGQGKPRSRFVPPHLRR